MADQYRRADWLVDRLRDVLTFYYPTGIDEEKGGYIVQLDEETGEIYDAESKHLVATTRYVVNCCLGARFEDQQPWLDAAEHGVEFLREGHYDPETGGYDWLLEGAETVDRKRVCYGHAFVLLAYARAHEAGIDGAREGIEATYDLLMEHFWEPAHHLCQSEFDGDFAEASEYRGQNANMHTCEAMLAAHEATGEARYLDRAREIAHALTVDLAGEHDGRLWEHYTESWDHDMEYNREKPKDLFRPWGYQPGHHIEWAKLLAILDRDAEVEWAIDRAEELFEMAIEHGWDDEFGGFYYTFDRDGQPIVEDKYGWPVAEGIGAAAALSERTGDDAYLDWYDRFWEYAQTHLTAPGGNFYTKLTRANEPIDTDEGPAVEPGYHPIGACFEGLRSL
ncbi:Prenyltransferase family protein containing thioredoxin domain [Halorhabdus sp. SVX81]|uniref:AGE family epimerase/isomerase n=1 Tax=Halorhabdus sp. SVX81 TaxID=2978283 RepID=UPI0023DAC6CF|nr:AGE family epimerase/isomerase [Halorhabdus sp. SVX81]WEL17267.1 Prenyltransferase family protein containing thioredoxin domain [Halorhabdus sp. SVX81]